jgi:uncharacterized protein YggE
MKRILPGVAVLAFGALILSGCANGTSRPAGAATTPAGATDTHNVTTRGVGTADGVPDTLTVIIGVQTRGASAKGALEDNNKKANALVQTLKSKGVAAKDLQTSELSIQPTYGNTGLQITGYQVSNMVTATLRDLAHAGALIDSAAAAAGDAVRVQQLSFSIGDDTAVRAKARVRAVQQAQAQADQMAKAAGAKLGRIRSITELPESGPTPYLAFAAEAKAPCAPIQAGQLDLRVTVEVSYDLDQ